MVLSLIYYDYPSSPRTLVVGVGRAVRGERLESLGMSAEGQLLGAVSAETACTHEVLLTALHVGRYRPENCQ